jgi:hypothetical protein
MQAATTVHGWGNRSRIRCRSGFSAMPLPEKRSQERRNANYSDERHSYTIGNPHESQPSARRVGVGCRGGRYLPEGQLYGLYGRVAMEGLARPRSRL